MTAPIRFINIDEGLPVDPSLAFGPRSEGFYSTYVKRGLDVALVLATSIITLPVIAILAVLVAMDGHSPFFVQRRVGRHGARFPMLKLRTMRVGAESLLQEHLALCPASAREWHVSQKLRHDPRVTRVGRFIRKTSLDELPQLLNVLKGDMSLVGPRPMLVEQEAIYSGETYFKMRPGVTGLWQVTARNGSSFEARALFDAAYAAKQSLLFDLLLMVRTVWVMARGTGV